MKTWPQHTSSSDDTQCPHQSICSAKLSGTADGTQLDGSKQGRLSVLHHQEKQQQLMCWFSAKMGTQECVDCFQSLDAKTISITRSLRAEELLQVVYTSGWPFSESHLETLTTMGQRFPSCRYVLAAFKFSSNWLGARRKAKMKGLQFLSSQCLQSGW